MILKVLFKIILQYFLLLYFFIIVYKSVEQRSRSIAYVVSEFNGLVSGLLFTNSSSLSEKIKYEQQMTHDQDVFNQFIENHKNCSDSDDDQFQNKTSLLSYQTQLQFAQIYQNFSLDFKSQYMSGEFQKHEYSIKYLLSQRNYYLVEYIGAGGEAEIFFAKQIFNQTQIQDCVIKIYYSPNKQKIEEEISIMKQIERNIHAMDFYEIIKSDTLSLLVMERCQIDLAEELDNIQNEEVPLSPQKLLQMWFDLIDGLLHFRVYNIAHLDIKPTNILLTKQGNYIHSDFGCSSKVKQSVPIKYKCSTQGYAPNELLNKSTSINYQSDVYSLGKTFEYIFNITQNITVDNKNNTYEFIPEFKRIIKEKMIQDKALNRADIQNLHELFFNEINKKKQKEFLEYYYEKLSTSQHQILYDNNKDIPYFLELQLYYHRKKEQIAKTLEMDYKQLSRINFEIGDTYSKQGNYKLALNYTLESLKILEIDQEGAPEETAQSMNSLGKIYRELGDFEKGLNYSQESIHIAENLDKPNLTLISDAMNNMGVCYFRQNNPQKAYTIAQKTLILRKSIVVDGNNPLIAESLNNIGLYLKFLGYYQNSINYYQESLSMWKNLQSGKHPSYAQILSNVCIYYSERGQLPIAFDFCLQSLEIFKQIYNKNHPVLARLLNNLADVHLKMSNSKIALGYILECLKISKDFFTDDHPQKTIFINTLWEIIYSF